MLTKIGLLIFLITFSSLPLTAQDSSGASSPSRSVAEPGITREQAAKIVQELQMIRALLQKEQDARERTTAPPSRDVGGQTEVGLSDQTLTGLGERIIGNVSAPITLVEFVDLQCSFCSQFHHDVLPELRRRYIDSDKVRFVVLDFPVPSHVYATSAAAFARCAGKQGKYWDVYDTYLRTPQVASSDSVQRIAADLKLDRSRLDECLADPKTNDNIRHDYDVGRSLGVFGTPTFLLGRSLPDGAIGRILQGAPSFDALERLIEELLPQDKRK